MTTVSLATPADVPGIVAAHFGAFRNSIAYALLFPRTTDDAYRGYSTPRFYRTIKDESKVLLVAKKDGVVVGGAIWHLPLEGDEKASTEEDEHDLAGDPEGTDTELMASYVAALDQKVTEKHWHLALVFVDPKAQRTGAGGALVKWGCDKADAAGLPSYLESSEIGLSVYKRYGFVVFRDAIKTGPKGELVNYPMKRPSQPLITPPRSLSISPAESNDLPRLAEIQLLAFAPSLINQLIFGQVPRDEFLRATITRLGKAIEDPGAAVCKAVDASGKIVGGALWELPKVVGAEGDKKEGEEETEEERLEKKRKNLPEGTNVELALSFFGQLELGIKEPHYHLALLFIDPTVQRTGAGAALLKWGCDRADKEGLSSYLESSTVGLGLYERYNYTRFRSPIVGGPDDCLVLYPMHRPPTPTSTTTPSLSISLATPSDVTTLASIHRRAFLPSTFYQSLWFETPPSAFETFHAGRAQKWLKTEGEHVVVARRSGGDKEGEMVGYGWWQRLEGKGGKKSVEELREEMELGGLPEGTKKELCRDFYARVEFYDQSIEGLHWHLQLLATDPEAQRTGAGRALVTWGVTRAHGEGLPVYLEAMPDAIAFYERLGFVKCAEPISASDGSFECYPMVLRPAAD